MAKTQKLSPAVGHSFQGFQSSVPFRSATTEIKKTTQYNDDDIFWEWS